MFSGDLLEIEVDLVILATGVRPRKGIEELCSIMSLERDEYGFIKADSINLQRRMLKVSLYVGWARDKDIPYSSFGGEAAA